MDPVVMEDYCQLKTSSLTSADLFGSVPCPRVSFASLPPFAGETVSARSAVHGISCFDERMLEIFERARNINDAQELVSLYLGRVESELGVHGLRPDLVAQWRSSSVRRRLDVNEVLNLRATARFFKELFNFFFRDDLYGALRRDHHLILSSGSVDEPTYSLPSVLKECLRYALDRDWYGYSDSRGRIATRTAIADYESCRIAGFQYGQENVAITLGGTFAVNAVSDFLLSVHQSSSAPALCALPNYPPLVESIGRRHNIRMVPLESSGGTMDLEPLINSLEASTPLVLLQTANNPTGIPVTEEQLSRLIRRASPQTKIVLDECHECVTPSYFRCSERASPNVIRVSSLSKTLSAPGLKIGWLLADSAFISEFYEYASTTYGGPPSFFYLLVEIMARMEQWMLQGLDDVGPAELSQFEGTYGLQTANLNRAYHQYRCERRLRDIELASRRQEAVDALESAGICVIRPSFSINLAFQLPGCNDSYLGFRNILRETDVALFPGVLTFCTGGWMRLTSSRPPDLLATALTRLVTCVRQERRAVAARL